MLKDELLEDVQKAYGLQWRVHDSPMISGSASPKAFHGQIGGLTFSLRSLGYWELIVGNLSTLGVMDLALSRVKNGSRPAKVELKKLDPENPITYPEGALADKFEIAIGHLDKKYLGPQLKSPLVEAGLLRLSEVADPVILYHDAIELQLNRKALTRNTFDSDLSYAKDVALGLAEYCESLNRS